MPAQIRGLTGELRWAYYCAAKVTRYVVQREDGHWSMTATIADADAFKMTQRPLMFFAPHAKGVWHWQVLRHRIDGDQFHASLGPPVD